MTDLRQPFFEGLLHNFPKRCLAFSAISLEGIASDSEFCVFDL